MFAKALITNRGENPAGSAGFRCRGMRAAHQPEQNQRRGTKHVR